MAEQGDFELFTGPAPAEQKEGGDEQFREEMRRTQQAIKDLKKEEGRAKASDDNLAKIIVQFLSQTQDTDLFLLISRAVAQNLPSELIIAVVSLIDEKALDETKAFLVTSGEKANEQGLVLHQKADFQSIGPEHKTAIDEWIRKIGQVAMRKPHRTLETMVIPGEKRELSPVLVQLATFILRNYLYRHKIMIDYEDLHAFMQNVFVEMLKNLETLVADQRKLSKAE